MVSNVFRTEKHTPDVYVKNSRDFQLFCRIFDIVYNAVKADIDSMENITDTNFIYNNLLTLLSDKVGFFEHSLINESDLRLICQGFPVIIKNKGTLLGIKQAINLFLKLNHITEKPTITIVNEELVNNGETNLYRLANSYRINIRIEATLRDTIILDRLLYYIVPTGYKISYKFTQTSFDETVIYYNQEVSNNPNYEFLESKAQIKQVITSGEEKDTWKTTVGAVATTTPLEINAPLEEETQND